MHWEIPAISEIQRAKLHTSPIDQAMDTTVEALSLLGIELSWNGTPIKSMGSIDAIQAQIKDESTKVTKDKKWTDSERLS